MKRNTSKRSTSRRSGGKRSRSRTSKRSSSRRKGGKTQDPDIIFLSDTLKHYKRNVEDQPGQAAHAQFRALYSRSICDALARLRSKNLPHSFPGYNSDSCTEEMIENDEIQDY